MYLPNSSLDQLNGDTLTLYALIPKAATAMDKTLILCGYGLEEGGNKQLNTYIYVRNVGLQFGVFQ